MSLKTKTNNTKKENPGIAYASGFDNPNDGFLEGPYSTLEEALDSYGTINPNGQDCYLYRVSRDKGTSKRIRKWNFIDDQWEYILK